MHRPGRPERHPEPTLRHSHHATVVEDIHVAPRGREEAVAVGVRLRVAIPPESADRRGQDYYVGAWICGPKIKGLSWNWNGE